MSVSGVASGGWGEFAAAAPELAATGRRLIYASGSGSVLLSTVCDDQPPRLHPISVAIVDGRLLAFILRSPKLTDLERDGRYAMHNHPDPAAPSEFAIRGRAREITEPAVRAAAMAVWPFEPDDTNRLFEFGIDSAVLGIRDTADEWPPRYSTWSAAAAT